MSSACVKLDAFVDGELSASDADAFRVHLGTCDACSHALHERMMLEAAVETHVAEMRAPSNVRPMAQGRKKRGRGPTLALVLAFVPAAAAAAWAIRASHAPDDAQVVASNAPLALASTRSIEARFAYGPVDKHRPYDVPRAAGSRPHENVPLSALADLEKGGDLHAVAAGLALAGEDERAAQYLERAGSSPDVDADRAALLLVERKTGEALDALDRVLAAHPAHPQALFNRALALRDLGLALAAAEAFDKVAALAEPGWSDEAKARAQALRAEHDARRDAWGNAKQAGLAMVAGGAPPGDAVVRTAPDLARHYLYHAVRSAPSRERVQALAPLAQQLDAIAGGHVLADWLARSAARDFAKRAPLAATYAKLVASADALDAKGATAYLAALRAAGESDLLLGALALVDPGLVDAREYALLAKTSADPWAVALAARAVATAQLAGGDYARAEETLRRGVASCAHAHVDWRCAQLEVELSSFLARESRTSEARGVALGGLARARASAYEMEARLAFRLGDIARLEDDLPLVRAYSREAELGLPDDCAVQRAAHEELAVATMTASGPDGALAVLADDPRCDQPMTILAADAFVDAVRMGHPLPDAVKNLASDLETASARFPPDERAFAEVVEARLAMTTDPATGDALARRALADAAKLPGDDTTARKAETYAHLTLAVEAARTNRASDALAELAAGAHAAADASSGACALGVAVDEDRAVAVARDPGGAAFVELVKRATTDFAPASLVGEGTRAHLAGCASVRVLALPPLHGLPALLPADVAWGYVSSASPAPAPAGPARRVVVTGTKPPASLALARLSDWSDGPGRDAVVVRGDEATPSRVLAEIADATEIEINAHGFADAAQSAASLLALSPDADGRYALSATDIRAARLRAHPVVVLGACHAAKTARYYREAWSLPSAFVAAGARAVLASAGEIPDAEAEPFFEAVLARIRAGAAPAVALRDERAAWLAKNPKSWVHDVIEFE